MDVIHAESLMDVSVACYCVMHRLSKLGSVKQYFITSMALWTDQAWLDKG